MFFGWFGLFRSKPRDKPRYVCKCGFPCYSKEQERFHKSRACLSIQRIMNVISARERLGVFDHVGLEAAGFKIEKEIFEGKTDEFL